MVPLVELPDPASTLPAVAAHKVAGSKLTVTVAPPVELPDPATPLAPAAAAAKEENMALLVESLPAAAAAAPHKAAGSNLTVTVVPLPAAAAPRIIKDPKAAESKLPVPVPVPVATARDSAFAKLAAKGVVNDGDCVPEDRLGELPPHVDAVPEDGLGELPPHGDAVPENGFMPFPSAVISGSRYAHGPVSHLFICFGRVDTWPSTGPLVPKESIPYLLARAIKCRGLHHQITLSLFDAGDSNEFVEGEIILFPQMKCYYPGVSEIDSFVDTVLLTGNTSSWHGEQRSLMGSFAFVCSHDHGDHLRECSVCGPIILSSLATEAHSQGLQGRLQFFACTALSESPGEMILFLATADGKCECVQYSEVFPGYLRPILSEHFGDGSLLMNTGPAFLQFWSLLRDILHAGAQARASIVALPYRLDVIQVKIIRELMVKTYVDSLSNTLILLRAAATACQPGEVSLEWLDDAARRELNLVVKSLYGSVRSVRDMVKARAMLSVLRPTVIDREVMNGVDHIKVLVHFGEMLGETVVDVLGGKAYPKGRELLAPICGIRIRE